MPNLFRRRPREPPSTGNFNSFASRRRQPVDPPSSHAAVKTGPRDPDDILHPRQPEPDIQLTGHQLELLNQRNGNQHYGIPPPKDPSEVGAPTMAFTRPTGAFAVRGVIEKADLVSDDDFLGDFEQTSRSSHLVSSPQPIASSSDDENQNSGPFGATMAKTSTIPCSSNESVEVRPFTSRSNTETAIKTKTTSSLASRRAKKERRSISAARSSVFRHGNSNDNDTVVSKASQKSGAASNNYSHDIRSTSSGTGSAVSAHDKTELRKLLMGSNMSETKTPASTTVTAKTSPTKSKPHSEVTAASADDGFDQREYLRNLIQQKGGSRRSAPNTTSTTAPKGKSKPAALSLARKKKDSPDLKTKGETSGKASYASNSHSGHSSALSSVDPMLQRVLNRSLNASKDTARRLLSPRSKGSKSPKSFSSPEISSSSPKRGKSGLKNYVRKKMGFSKKSSGTSPKSDNISLYNTNLAKSTSTDSGDRSTPMSRDAANDNTRTTLASSSNLSDDDTKRTYDSNLKQITTAGTLDTDASSTIMGNLQTNSSLRTTSNDSMQYSIEEGCDDSSGRKSTIRAINGFTNHATLIKDSVGYNEEARLAYPSDNQGYNTFLAALQLEASGTHSQIWSSFQSAMTGAPRKFPPRNDKNSQFKFDPPTKKMLGSMNLHLKRQALVECASEAQLVSDKQFSQEVEKGLKQRKTRFSADAKTFTPMEILPESKVVAAEKEVHIQPAPLGEKEEKALETKKVTMRGEEVSGAMLDTTQLSHTGRESHFDKYQLPSGKSPSMPESNSTLATQIAAVKLGKPRRSAGSRQSLPPPMSATQGEANLPWSAVQLRSVSSRDASDEPQSVSPHSTKRNTMPSPWARVKLRRIPDEDMEPIERAEAEQQRMQDHDDLIIDVITGTTNEKSNLLPLTDTIASTTKRTVTPDPIQNEQKQDEQTGPLPEILKAQKAVDKGSATSQKQSSRDTTSDKQVDEVTVILEVKTLQDMPQEKVVVGKKVVELYRAGSEPLTLWSFPRDAIKSLKLDMESQSVYLSLVSGGEAKVLSFNNATDCLQFANAFYEMHQPSKIQASEEESIEKTTSKKRPLEELNDEEQRVLETYRQARLTKAPVEAIREVVSSPTQKKSLHESLLASVLCANKTDVSADKTASVKQPPSSLSPNEVSNAESYEKMLKMRIPLAAVQHKMAKDGVDSKIVNYIMSRAGDSSGDSCLSDEPALPKKPTALDEKSLTNLTDEEEAIAAPFRKMLKMMIPKEGVRHKMLKEQVETKIIDAVIGNGDSSFEVKLSLAEKATAAKYKKMLKLQMPRDAVRHNMEKDQVSQKIIGFVLGIKGGSDSLSGANQQSQASQRASKLVSLHWTPLSGKELDNSVWAAKKNSVAPTQPEGSDISKLVELFQKKSTVKIAKAKGGESDSGIGKAKLIDLNRANIVAISLKAFKDFSHDELASILQYVDPDHKLHGERVQFVRDLLPTPTEIAAVKRYYGGPERLVPAEQWFQKIVHIKRLEAKAHVLHTMEVFESEVAEIQERLQMLTRVCTQVMESERLRELLDMVLQIGNIMNEGTRTGGASGFKFDSLLRLTQTKSGDGKTTVLDYMVTIYFAKDQKTTLDLMEDFPECPGASRMLIADLVANVKDTSDKLVKCKREYEALLSDKSGVAGLKKVSSDCGNACDPRQQLFAAITARSSEKSEENASAKSVSKDIKPKLDAFGQGGNKSNHPDGLQAGIAKLKGFLENAERTYEKLKQDSDLAVETCREMSQYCGESGGERSTDALLGVLSEFANKLASAVQKHERMLAAEAKKQTRQTAPLTPTKKVGVTTPKRTPEPNISKKNGSMPPAFPKKAIQEGRTPASKTEGIEEAQKISKARPSPESNTPRGKGTSLVLMVNELLKDSTEEAKRDFSQGVVYSDPDEKLKAIYEREKRVVRSGMPPLPRRSMDGDLMATIRKRNGSTDGVVAKEKRSQLERVIDCINCASGTPDSECVSQSAESETMSSTAHHPADKFADLQSKWKDQTSRGGSNRSLVSFAPSEDEGSVCNPIDCSDIEDASDEIIDASQRR